MTESKEPHLTSYQVHLLSSQVNPHLHLHLQQLCMHLNWSDWKKTPRTSKSRFYRSFACTKYYHKQIFNGFYQWPAKHCTQKTLIKDNFIFSTVQPSLVPNNIPSTETLFFPSRPMRSPPGLFTSDPPQTLQVIYHLIPPQTLQDSVQI